MRADRPRWRLLFAVGAGVAVGFPAGVFCGFGVGVFCGFGVAVGSGVLFGTSVSFVGTGVPISGVTSCAGVTSAPFPVSWAASPCPFWLPVSPSPFTSPPA